MSIFGVAPAGATNSAPSTGKNSLSSLGSQDFLKLLLAQLQNQNPLSPVNGSDFIAQTAQFTQVDALTQLNTNITQLLTSQQVSQASSLIGKKISYQKAGVAGLQSGVVSAVSIANGKVQLTAGTDLVDLSSVQSIQAA